jgi:hypothetical protein
MGIRGRLHEWRARAPDRKEARVKRRQDSRDRRAQRGENAVDRRGARIQAEREQHGGIAGKHDWGAD